MRDVRSDVLPLLLSRAESEHAEGDQTFSISLPVRVWYEHTKKSMRIWTGRRSAGNAIVFDNSTPTIVSSVRALNGDFYVGFSASSSMPIPFQIVFPLLLKRFEISFPFRRGGMACVFFEQMAKRIISEQISMCAAFPSHILLLPPLPLLLPAYMFLQRLRQCLASLGLLVCAALTVMDLFFRFWICAHHFSIELC